MAAKFFLFGLFFYTAAEASQLPFSEVSQKAIDAVRDVVAEQEQNGRYCEDLDRISEVSFQRPVPKACPSVAAIAKELRQADAEFRGGCHAYIDRVSELFRDPYLCESGKDGPLLRSGDRWQADESTRMKDSFEFAFSAQGGPLAGEASSEECRLSYFLLQQAHKRELALFGKNAGSTLYLYQEACETPKPGELSNIDYFYESKDGRGCH